MDVESAIRNIIYFGVELGISAVNVVIDYFQTINWIKFIVHAMCVTFKFLWHLFNDSLTIRQSILVLIPSKDRKSVV